MRVWNSCIFCADICMKAIVPKTAGLRRKKLSITIEKMKTIRISAHTARSFSENLFGLLVFPVSSALFLRTRWGIHTFWMKKPIDVLILDTKGKVVDMREHMRPFRVYFWNPIYSRVVELPGGYIQKHDIQKEDKVSIIYDWIRLSVS